MPSPKWMIFTVMSWVSLAILGGIIEKVYLGARGEVGVLNKLANLPVFTGGLTPASIFRTVFNPEFWQALGTMLIFDFAMFQGTWAIFNYIFFLPISIAMVVTFTVVAVSLIRGGGG